MTAVSDRPAADPQAAGAVPVLDLHDVRKLFPVRRGVLRRVQAQVHALDGVSLTVSAGATLGLVGESGSGKSTLGRVALRLIEPTSGRVLVDGTDLGRLHGRALRRFRARMQMVFQDPYSSLDPKATVVESVGEPLRTHRRMRRRARDAAVGELLELVGLPQEHRRRYPGEFSGGQLQRVALARALALRPRLVVLDEPVSSLDVSTQAEVINLLERLQHELGVTYLLVAHDLSLVRHASTRIAVMYLGRIVEIGAAEQVYREPKHPYTEALLSAIPVPDPTAQRRRERIVLPGDVPDPTAPPAGCRFHTRCPRVMDVCRHVDPSTFTAPDGTVVHCHLHTDGPRLAGASVRTLPAS